MLNIAVWRGDAAPPLRTPSFLRRPPLAPLEQIRLGAVRLGPATHGLRQRGHDDAVAMSSDLAPVSLSPPPGSSSSPTCIFFCSGELVDVLPPLESVSCA